jgi:uncharacterized protein (DUF983 family)
MPAKTHLLNADWTGTMCGSGGNFPTLVEADPTCKACRKALGLPPL